MSTSVPPGSGEPDQPDQPEQPEQSEQSEQSGYSSPFEGYTQPIPPPPPPSTAPSASSGGYGAPPPPASGQPPVPPPSAPVSTGSYSAPPPAPAGRAMPAADNYDGDGPLVPSNFFGRLFDLSFRSFVTPSVVKILYVLAMALIVIGWLGFSISAFQLSAAFGLLVLVIFGPLYALFLLILVRVTLEFYIAIIRVAQDVEVIKGNVDS